MNERTNESLRPVNSLPLTGTGTMPYFNTPHPFKPPAPESPSSSPQLQFAASPSTSQRKPKPLNKSSYNLLLPSWKPLSSGLAPSSLPLYRASPLPCHPFRRNKPSPDPSHSGTQPFPFVPLRPPVLLAVTFKSLLFESPPSSLHLAPATLSLAFPAQLLHCPPSTHSPSTHLCLLCARIPPEWPRSGHPRPRCCKSNRP